MLLSENTAIDYLREIQKRVNTATKGGLVKNGFHFLFSIEETCVILTVPKGWILQSHYAIPQKFSGKNLTDAISELKNYFDCGQKLLFTKEKDDFNYSLWLTRKDGWITRLHSLDDRNQLPGWERKRKAGK